MTTTPGLQPSPGNAGHFSLRSEHGSATLTWSNTMNFLDTAMKQFWDIVMETDNGGQNYILFLMRTLYDLDHEDYKIHLQDEWWKTKQGVFDAMVRSRLGTLIGNEISQMHKAMERKNKQHDLDPNWLNDFWKAGRFRPQSQLNNLSRKHQIENPFLPFAKDLPPE